MCACLCCVSVEKVHLSCVLSSKGDFFFNTGPPSCVQVSFTSLDVVLHSEALLSAVNFLSLALWSGTAGRETRPAAEGHMLAPKSSQYQSRFCDVVRRLPVWHWWRWSMFDPLLSS